MILKKNWLCNATHPKGGLGAVITQEGAPIAYASRALTPTVSPQKRTMHKSRRSCWQLSLDVTVLSNMSLEIFSTSRVITNLWKIYLRNLWWKHPKGCKECWYSCKDSSLLSSLSQGKKCSWPTALVEITRQMTVTPKEMKIRNTSSQSSRRYRRSLRKTTGRFWAKPTS